MLLLYKGKNISCKRLCASHLQPTNGFAYTCWKLSDNLPPVLWDLKSLEGCTASSPNGNPSFMRVLGMMHMARACIAAPFQTPGWIITLQAPLVRITPPLQQKIKSLLDDNDSLPSPMNQNCQKATDHALCAWLPHPRVFSVNSDGPYDQTTLCAFNECYWQQCRHIMVLLCTKKCQACREKLLCGQIYWSWPWRQSYLCHSWRYGSLALSTAYSTFICRYLVLWSARSRYFDAEPIAGRTWRQTRAPRYHVVLQPVQGSRNYLTNFTDKLPTGGWKHNLDRLALIRMTPGSATFTDPSWRDSYFFCTRLFFPLATMCTFHSVPSELCDCSEFAWANTPPLPPPNGAVLHGIACQPTTSTHSIWKPEESSSSHEGVCDIAVTWCIVGITPKRDLGLTIETAIPACTGAGFIHIIASLLRSSIE